MFLKLISQFKHFSRVSDTHTNPVRHTLQKNEGKNIKVVLQSFFKAEQPQVFFAFLCFDLSTRENNRLKSLYRSFIIIRFSDRQNLEVDIFAKRAMNKKSPRGVQEESFLCNIS